MVLFLDYQRKNRRDQETRESERREAEAAKARRSELFHQELKARQEDVSILESEIDREFGLRGRLLHVALGRIPRAHGSDAYLDGLRSLEERLRSGEAPEFVLTWEDAERVAHEWMLDHGYPDAEPTSRGSDAGIDVRSSSAVAQIKLRTNSRVGRPDLQRLVGAAAGSRCSSP